MESIDCRGLACPGPVLQAKEAIEAKGVSSLKVLVDNEAAKVNVSRFLASQGFDVSVTPDGADFAVIGKRKESADRCEICVPESANPEAKKILVMVTTDRMGHGDDELGKKLMVSYLNTLKEMGEELWRLVFVNNGVKLTIDGSEVLPVLKELDNQGVHILVCGTCLTYFDLLNRKQVGETTNMLDIVTSLQVADKVINL